MRKKSLLMVVACTALATANAPTTAAQEIAGIENSPTTTLPITGVTEATDGNYNFKSFEVEASEAGAYYTEFWLQPAKYANNLYTTFMVYVNDEYVGSITPTFGNWQSARVDGHETLDLSEGVNVITVATLAPEFPDVETLKVAASDIDAEFSSDAYENYLNDAIQGIQYDVSTEEDSMMISESPNSSANIAHFSNVPLTYTFYNDFSFTKEQEVIITTSSSNPHKIDIVYFGSPNIYNTHPGIQHPINSGDIDSLGSTVHGLSPTVKIKRMYAYRPATSEEMQGLSWVFPSEKALNASTYLATARLDIPKTGRYLIRVRHTVNGGSGVADVNVNGAYFYENSPISLSYKNCTIPADEKEYATFTCCNNFGEDDPVLFIHGGDCDKVVGFNDDAPSAKINQYNISQWDSYISQMYNTRTSRISVNNYSSSNPISRCNIIARVSEEAAQSVAKARDRGTDTAEVFSPSIIDESVMIIGPENINGQFSITANDNIQKVSVYGLAGNCVGSVNGNGSCIYMPASSLNITQRGIYIISVETATGVTSKKVTVK